MTTTPETPASEPEREVDTGTRLSYALGSLAPGAFGTVPGFLLVIFLTDTLGVAAAVAGLAVAVPKFWDVIFNPIVGTWSDRTNSKMGPRRPWMLAGALTLPVFFVAMFAVPPTWSPNVSAMVVAALFLLAASGFAMFQVPYVALPAEMTTHYAERTTIVAWRIVALTVGILVSGALSPMIVKWGGGGTSGHVLMAVSIAVFMCVSMLIAVFGTKRARHTAVPSGNTGLLVAFRTARRNPYYLPLWLAYILQALANAAALATVPYVAKYVMGAPGAESLLFIALVAPAILVMPLWSWVARRHGKARGYLLSSLCYLAGVLGMLALRGLPTGAIPLLVVLMGCGYAGMQLFPLAMLPDTVSVDEARSGERRSGMLTGLWTAGETAAFAIGPGLVGLVLGIFGFVSSTGDDVVAQPDSALWGIVVAIAVLPAIAMGLSLVLISRYTLTEEVLERELAAAPSRVG